MQIPEIKTNSTAQIEIPVQFSRLRDIAYNLWWSWCRQPRMLFRMIDPAAWERYRNPIELLIDMEPERWYTLQNDERFLRAYRDVVDQFDSYMFPDEPTWFAENYPHHDGRPVVYFSTEFGWHESLQIYSGGLGVLSGDHSKSASDLGLPFIGVGLMYRRGYFRQTIDADGQQQHFYPDYDVHRIPVLPVVDSESRPLQLSLELPGRPVHFKVWKAGIGRVPVLLLDTDLHDNHPADRSITSVLYISGREMRLCQEIVLGLGGVHLLETLGIQPSMWHMNEGHSALLSLSRAADTMRRTGCNLTEACTAIARNAVFTTHTPVPAGNESFEPALVRRQFEEWSARNGVDLDEVLALGRNGQDESFNLTAMALRTSSRTNGVSELHGRVADDMWRDLLSSQEGRKVEHITNGVHLPSWTGPEIEQVLRRHLGVDYERHLLDPGFAKQVEAIPDHEIWDAHLVQKRRLVDVCRERALEQFARHGMSPDELRQLDQLLDPTALLIGFARRFATYKRADLILRDLDRLKALMSAQDRTVQFLFAGKAHPADRPGQELIRRIWHASKDGDLKGRLLFLENYDMRVGRFMVQGVDVWLNNPRRPMEASGTSGMKVAMNGGLNCSILDGWWCEGYDPSHGWAIGTPDGDQDEQSQDRVDSESLYRVLGDEIVPCYYHRDESGLPLAWIQRMKKAIGMLSPRFSTSRMVRDYTEKFYLGQRRPATSDVSGSVAAS